MNNVEIGLRNINSALEKLTADMEGVTKNVSLLQVSAGQNVERNMKNADSADNFASYANNLVTRSYSFLASFAICLLLDLLTIFGVLLASQAMLVSLNPQTPESYVIPLTKFLCYGLLVHMFVLFIVVSYYFQDFGWRIFSFSRGLPGKLSYGILGLNSLFVGLFIGNLLILPSPAAAYFILSSLSFVELSSAGRPPPPPAPVVTTTPSRE